MNIKKLFGKNKSLVNSCLVYLTCFMKLFQIVNSTILCPTGGEETAWARTIGLNRGFASWNPSPVKLHCQVNISTLHLLTMHAVSLSENVSQAVRVKIKIYRGTKQVTLVKWYAVYFHQLHCFVFYENLNTKFN